MKQRHILAGTAGLLVLAVGACADNEPDPVDTEPTEVVVVDFDPMTTTYTLTPEQQERRDAVDMDAFQEEYGGYRDVIVARATPPAMGTAGSETTTSGSSGSTDSATGMTGGGDAGAIPARSDMDWSYLDRNNDGQLSVAEYAIWAVPLDPTEPAPNDEKAPHLTSDEANLAADSFFFYDRDGNTYLSQEEFTAARRGETFS